MKILYVDLTTGTGGAIISLAQLLSRLDRAEFQPTVLLAAHSQGRGRLEAVGVPVITLPTVTADTAHSTALVQAIKSAGPARRLFLEGPLARPWAWARGVRDLLMRTAPLTCRLYRTIRRLQPDLVHVNVISSAALAAAWLAGRPVVCHMRWQGPLTAWERMWARTVRRFVFISRWIAEHDATQGIPAGRGRLIYNGLDLAPYQDLPDRTAARVRLGLPANRPIVADMGRLVPWKGQDLFLRAMRRVVDAEPNAFGLIIGEAEEFSRDFAAGLPALAAELGLANAVRFTGFLADVPAAMAAIDLLAHTAVEPEPFGRVLIEAMAAERPVVSPDEGGGAEIVAHGRTGLLYPPGDEAALAAAIIRLLRDPRLAAEMGQAGRARVIEMFSLEQHVQAMVDLYRELETEDVIGNKRRCHPERVHPVYCVAASIQRRVWCCMKEILRWFHAAKRGSGQTRSE
jgi:glycosyltransferase involved in cell wall biosynthesis